MPLLFSLIWNERQSQHGSILRNRRKEKEAARKRARQSGSKTFFLPNVYHYHEWKNAPMHLLRWKCKKKTVMWSFLPKIYCCIVTSAALRPQWNKTTSSAVAETLTGVFYELPKLIKPYNLVSHHHLGHCHNLRFPQDETMTREVQIQNQLSPVFVKN